MSYVRVSIHAVWGTKNRQPVLTKDVRAGIIEHIRANAREKGIHILAINGYTQHLHCLFHLNADRSIAKTMQLIKGESAHWINENRIVPGRFEWANEYFALSVSESVVEIVRRYIDNQEEHHRKESFAEEVSQFAREFKIENQG